MVVRNYLKKMGYNSDIWLNKPKKIIEVDDSLYISRDLLFEYMRKANNIQELKGMIKRLTKP